MYFSSTRYTLLLFPLIYKNYATFGKKKLSIYNNFNVFSKFGFTADFVFSYFYCKWMQRYTENVQPV